MSRETCGGIYKITNNINNKIYIGQTSNFRKRIHTHIHLSKDSKIPISLAIKKYGKENFSYEIICECEDKVNLLIYEGLFIELYKSYDPKIGYNRIRRVDGQIIFSDLSRGYKTSNSKSKYFGVGIRNNFYTSRIWIKEKYINIGCFLNEIDAAKAYDILELEYFGENAILNFPKLKNDYLSKKIKVERIVKSKNSTSSIKCVSFTSYKKWEVDIRNKKIKYRALFECQKEAEEKAIEIHTQIGTKNYYKNTDPYVVFEGFKTKD
jgi:group I intron endonuclease